jgi:hypothetical protein
VDRSGPSLHPMVGFGVSGLETIDSGGRVRMFELSSVPCLTCSPAGYVTLA